MSDHPRAADAPHHCRCATVSTCQIHTHPDAAVHAALNRLVEEVSRYDDETDSTSRLAFDSRRSDGGTFASITASAAPALRDSQGEPTPITELERSRAVGAARTIHHMPFVRTVRREYIHGLFVEDIIMRYEARVGELEAEIASLTDSRAAATKAEPNWDAMHRVYLDWTKGRNPTSWTNQPEYVTDLFRRVLAVAYDHPAAATPRTPAGDQGLK